MSFNEKLAVMRAKQEAGDNAKKEQAEKAAAEIAQREREARKGDLSAKREQIMAEFSATEQEAAEAVSAVQEAEAFAVAQGENLDPEAKAEIDGIKVAAAETIAKFDGIKAEIAAIDEEIKQLEAGVTPAESAVEPAVEMSAEEKAEQEYLNKVKEEMPSLENERGDYLFDKLSAKGKKDKEWANKVFEYATDHNIGKEGEKGKYTKDEWRQLAEAFKGDLGVDDAVLEMRAAAAFLGKAENQSEYKVDSRKLQDMGEKGANTLADVWENQMDATLAVTNLKNIIKDFKDSRDRDTALEFQRGAKLRETSLLKRRAEDIKGGKLNISQERKTQLLEKIKTVALDLRGIGAGDVRTDRENNEILDSILA